MRLVASRAIASRIRKVRRTKCSSFMALETEACMLLAQADICLIRAVLGFVTRQAPLIHRGMHMGSHRLIRMAFETVGVFLDVGRMRTRKSERCADQRGKYQPE